MSRLTALLGIVAGGFALFGACQTPTSIMFVFRTDVDCASTTPRPVAFVSVGVPDQVSRPLAFREPTSTKDCDVRVAAGELGDVGTLVALPASSEDVEVGMVVVLGVTRQTSGCGAVDAKHADPWAGCIIARRRLAFLEGEALAVEVPLYLDCVGVPCDETSTCVPERGCVSSEIDPDDCLEGRCGDDDLATGASSASASSASTSDASSSVSSSDSSSSSEASSSVSSGEVTSSATSSGGEGGVSVSSGGGGGGTSQGGGGDGSGTGGGGASDGGGGSSASGSGASGAGSPTSSSGDGGAGASGSGASGAGSPTASSGDGGAGASGSGASGAGSPTSSSGDGGAGASGSGASGAGSPSASSGAGGGLADGAECQIDDECSSLFCEQGICCAGPCSSGCSACRSDYTGVQSGTCATVVLGEDPNDACGGPCNQCDGVSTDECATVNCFCNADEECAQCLSDGTFLPGTCAAGSCTDFGGPPLACPGDVRCFDGQCLATSCQNNWECRDGFECDAGTCTPQP